jgi:hypothetical protein
MGCNLSLVKFCLAAGINSIFRKDEFVIFVTKLLSPQSKNLNFEYLRGQGHGKSGKKDEVRGESPNLHLSQPFLT